MKVSQRITSVILTAAMLVTLAAGCTGEKAAGEAPGKTQEKAETTQDKALEYLNSTGFPIVKQPLTLQVMVSKNAAQPDFQEILTWKEYEKLSGIKINWENIPSSGIAEKRNLAVASGDMPDIFYRCSIPDKDVLKYGQQGAFIKLNALIDKYAPNFKQVIERMPEVKKSTPAYDGNIYQMPALSDNPAVEINPKLYIRKTWVDKVGMQLPKTSNELYALLTAFKKQDCNGNGKPDEIPITAQSYGHVENSLLGAWGLKNRGSSHSYVDMDEKNKKLRFIPIEPYYKEVIEFAAKLYKEGLLDQEIFTMNATQVTAKGEQNLVGSFSFTNTMTVGGTYEKEYVGLAEALEGPHGDKIWPNKRSHIASRGSFTITSSNKYPEASIRWVDYFYGDEGQKLLYMGVEGVSYSKRPDGTYKLLDEIVNNIPKGSTYDQVVSKYTPFAGGALPALAPDKYFQGGEMQPAPIAAAKNMEKYIPKEIWGQFSYSAEENDRLIALENDMLSYVNQMVPMFVMGKTPMSEWDAYVAQVKKLGLEEYMKIYNAAYERYSKN